MSDNITLVGNIVGDLESRTTRGGDPVTAFRLAAGDRRFDRERGQWVDGHTNYYAVSVFGELGRHALTSLRKGERVLLVGRLRLREWETDAKRGLSADVTAVALGHDLRWGTSSFTRLGAAGTSRGNDDSPQAWAVPGAGLGDADAANSPAAGSLHDTTAADCAATSGRAPSDGSRIGDGGAAGTHDSGDEATREHDADAPRDRGDEALVGAGDARPF